MREPDSEISRQEGFAWSRSGFFEGYNTVLGHYQAQACLEYARGASLLDVPCGDGLLTSMLAERFSRVVGVDASSAHLAKARERMPQAEFHHALLEDFQTGERFDTISMLNVLEHLADPVAALRKVAGLLAPDGILIVHVPNALAVNRQIATIMGTLTDCYELSPFDIDIAGHRRSYDMATLLEHVREAGLHIAATGGVFYKMLSTPQMDWFLQNGPWEEGGFGWGRVGAKPRDWRSEFCRACYEYGRRRPEDCNIIYACATLK
ncbi:methyltransferase [Solidesulfovibrio sp.]|uniref:class I SAM-dependent methyltransferase n=1 Tax=Solidesulfovibrio sp. TaxID=2910990 RepID=UPI0026162176|nr:methyltransferase [Solidesulfovibrio sp.]